MFLKHDEHYIDSFPAGKVVGETYSLEGIFILGKISCQIKSWLFSFS
jgi:hypothetical protein